MRRAMGAILLALLAQCSVSSLDDLKGEPDASADAKSGQCIAKQDCSGCSGCAYYCACVAGDNPIACLLSCQDSGAIGSGGESGTVSSGGWPGTDAAGEASPGCGPDQGEQGCLDCCVAAHSVGRQQYDQMLTDCLCSTNAVCATPCYDFCQGGVTASSDCQQCITANETCFQNTCKSECNDYILCYEPCIGA